MIRVAGLPAPPGLAHRACHAAILAAVLARGVAVCIAGPAAAAALLLLLLPVSLGDSLWHAPAAPSARTAAPSATAGQARRRCRGRRESRGKGAAWEKARRRRGAAGITACCRDEPPMAVVAASTPAESMPPAAWSALRLRGVVPLLHIGGWRGRRWLATMDVLLIVSISLVLVAPVGPLPLAAAICSACSTRGAAAASTAAAVSGAALPPLPGQPRWGRRLHHASLYALE